MDGLAHFHSHGLCHTDLKPANVLLRPGPPPPPDNPDARLAEWLHQLPDAMPVCISDLGSAIPGHPEHRPLARDSRIRVHGLEAGTLWYRAPEILLGQAAFSYPVDVWSVGCMAAEMLLKKPLFRGQSQVDMFRFIFQMFGTPQAGTLVGLPLLSKNLPAFVAAPCPPLGFRLEQLIAHVADIVQETRTSCHAARTS